MGQLRAKPGWEFKVCGSSLSTMSWQELCCSPAVFYSHEGIKHSQHTESTSPASGHPGNRLCLWNLGAGCTPAESPSSSADPPWNSVLPEGEYGLNFCAITCMCCLAAPSCFPLTAVAATEWKKATRKTILV